MKKQRYRLHKGRIDPNDAQWGMINQATIHEMSLRIPERNVNARMVYVLLCTFADEKGICWPSQGLLARILDVNRPTIVQAFKTLVDLGFIKTKKVRGTKSLKVQIYSVQHQLKFQEDDIINEVDEDMFPDSEDGFDGADTISDVDVKQVTCSLGQTDKSLSHHTDSCKFDNSISSSEQTQTYQVTNQLNRPIEETTPPTKVDPPEGDLGLKEELPKFLTSSELLQSPNGGVLMPGPSDNASDLVWSQPFTIQHLFFLIRSLNLHWGFDVSDFYLTERDVLDMTDALNTYTYDVLMDNIQGIAMKIKQPTAKLYFSYFRKKLNETA